MEKFTYQTTSFVTGLLALIFTLIVVVRINRRGVFSEGGGGLIMLSVLGFFVLVGWIDLFIWLVMLIALIGIYGLKSR